MINHTNSRFYFQGDVSLRWTLNIIDIWLAFLLNSKFYVRKRSSYVSLTWSFKYYHFFNDNPMKLFESYCVFLYRNLIKLIQFVDNLIKEKPIYYLTATHNTINRLCSKSYWRQITNLKISKNDIIMNWPWSALAFFVLQLLKRLNKHTEIIWKLYGCSPVSHHTQSK